MEFEFSGSGRRQRKLDEVHEVKISQKAKADEARGAWMEDERALHSVAFQECFSAGDAFDDLGGKIFSGEKHGDERFVKRGIFEQRVKNFG